MSQEIAIIATNARPIGPNMTYVREETITVSEPLTDAERLEYGQEMADALAKIEEYEAALDAERKHYKRLIETQEKIAQTASNSYRDGKEEREVRLRSPEGLGRSAKWSGLNPQNLTAKSCAAR